MENEVLVRNENNEIVIDEETQKVLIFLDKQIKSFQDTQEQIRKNILDQMQKHGIVKIENEYVRINLIEAGTREEFNKKQFKKDHGDLYDSYVSLKETEPHIAITFKDKKKEDGNL